MTQDNENVNDENYDDILDMTEDEVADLPSFNAFPAGVVIAGFSYEMKTITPEGKPVMKGPEIAMTYVSALEFNDPNSVPPNPGDRSTVFFNLLDEKFGAPKLKDLCKQGAALLGLAPGWKFREVLDGLNGYELAFTVTTRKNRKDKTDDRIYQDIKMISNPAEAAPQA